MGIIIIQREGLCGIMVILYNKEKYRRAFMENNIIYHGSNVEVAVPRILQNGCLYGKCIKNVDI